jgi:Tol biopolymer transport system component
MGYLLLNRYGKKITTTIIAGLVFISSAQAQNNPTAGIIAAGAKPALFAPGVVSNGDDVWAVSFMPNGQTAYFTRNPGVICYTALVNNEWGPAKTANFSGKWTDMDPFISPDGKRLYYSSYRPRDGDAQDKPEKFAHIWYVELVSGNEWSAPHHIGAPVNLEGISNYSPSISSKGTLCFSSPLRDTLNKKKSYASKWLGDHFAEPELLALIGPANVGDPCIAPDESYLVFKSTTDIYISYPTAGKWGDGQKLGPQINNGDKNSSPSVSPDGKMLYYSADSIKGILMIPVNLGHN